MQQEDQNQAPESENQAVETEQTPEARIAELEAQLIEQQAAVLYASGQEQAAKVLLQYLTTQETTSRFQEQLVWWMLFDLLQIQSAHQEFEQLSVQYAVRFETSPPQWTPPHANKNTDQTLSARVHFRGKLSAENHAGFDPCRKINANNKKIEFALDSISEIEDSGCKTLLNFLLQWSDLNYQYQLQNR